MQILSFFLRNSFCFQRRVDFYFLNFYNKAITAWRRQNTESIGGQEDDVLSVGACGDRTDDLLNVVDGVGNAGVLGDGAVSEVALAVLINSNVLQQSVALDGVVDIGLGVSIQVDDLCVAAALEIEDAVVIPAVLVVADQQTLAIMYS